VSGIGCLVQRGANLGKRCVTCRLKFICDLVPQALRRRGDALDFQFAHDQIGFPSLLHAQRGGGQMGGGLQRPDDLSSFAHRHGLG
jgi:hypothetical protein